MSKFGCTAVRFAGRHPYEFDQAMEWVLDATADSDDWEVCGQVPGALIHQVDEWDECPKEVGRA